MPHRLTAIIKDIKSIGNKLSRPHAKSHNFSKNYDARPCSCLASDTDLCICGQRDLRDPDNFIYSDMTKSLNRQAMQRSIPFSRRTDTMAIKLWAPASVQAPEQARAVLGYLVRLIGDPKHQRAGGPGGTKIAP